MVGMLDDIAGAFRMRGNRGVGMLRLQLQQFGFRKRLVHDARARPQQHVAAGDAVQIGAQMPVRPEDDLLVLGQLVDDLFRRRTGDDDVRKRLRSEEHTSELQSLMRISYAVFCLKKKNKSQTSTYSKYQY